MLMEIARVGDRAVDENGSSCGTTPLRVQTVRFHVGNLGGKMKLHRNFILFFFCRGVAGNIDPRVGKILFFI